MDHLPHAFGFGEVAQPLGAEVGEPHRAGPRAHERSGHVRHEDLAAMAHRHDAGGAIDGAASEVVAEALHLTGVHAHPHLEADRRQVPLGRDRGLHSGVG